MMYCGMATLAMTGHGQDARATSRTDLLVFRRGNLHDDAAGRVVGHVANDPSQQRFAQRLRMGLVVAHHQQIHALFLGHAHNRLTHFPSPQQFRGKRPG